MTVKFENKNFSTIIPDEIIKNKINQELKKLNYNFSHIGTQYLVDAILILYNSQNHYNFSLEKNVYPIIANKYGDTSNNIKSNIIYATDKMFYDCDEEKLKEYLDEYYISKPGPKKIIRFILKKI